MDKLTTAFLKALATVCLWTGVFIGVLLGLYFTVSAFNLLPGLGILALFVDAVLIGTLYHYEKEEKKSDTEG